MSFFHESQSTFSKWHLNCYVACNSPNNCRLTTFFSCQLYGVTCVVFCFVENEQETRFMGEPDRSLSFLILMDFLQIIHSNQTNWVWKYKSLFMQNFREERKWNNSILQQQLNQDLKHPLPSRIMQPRKPVSGGILWQIVWRLSIALKIGRWKRSKKINRKLMTIIRILTTKKKLFLYSAWLVLTFSKFPNIYVIVCLNIINAPVIYQCSCVIYMYMTNGTGFEFSITSHYWDIQ